MEERDISELRRRFKVDRTNITQICGCYVNDNREIISTFSHSVALAPQEETEKYLAIFKRTLTGGLGRNLIDIDFTTKQVQDSDEHRLLTTLKDSKLKDEDALKTIYDTIISSLSLEGNYLILLAHDSYDVPHRGKDGNRDDDRSSEVYSYILCSICPVKLTKPALSYVASESEFHNRKLDWVVSMPELGFLFPAFDARRTNIYSALYYTHSLAENHAELVDALFHREAPMPAAAQKDTFEAMLGTSLAEECSLEVVQAVHSQLRDMIEEHKQSREEEHLSVSKFQVESVLTNCGVSKPARESFGEKFNEEFGEDAALPPRNIIDTKQLEVRTPDVTIRVNPERSDLVETRIIGGVKYILICADDGVEVNGVPINIEE